MNIPEILKGLKTPEHWATFVLGVCVGVTLAGSVLVGLKNALNLDLVTKTSYYTQEQVASSFVPTRTIEQLYIRREEVATNYLAKSEVERNYLPSGYVAERYILKTEASAPESPKVDLSRYMLRSELSNYISRQDVQRQYYSKATCLQEVLSRKPVRENWTLNPGNQVSLPSAGIKLRSDNESQGYIGWLEVWREGEQKAVVTGTHFERYEYYGRRFTFKVLSATKGIFRVSLTEDE